jgi:tetratricopeptide (TPR) repeat protein
MAKSKKSKRLSIEKLVSRLTPGDFGRAAVWLGLVWLTTMVVVLNWTSRSKVVAPNNDLYRLTLDLKKAESKLPPDIPTIDQIRADLIVAHLNTGQEVKARELLSDYVKSLDDVSLKPAELLKLRSKLAFLYMSLKDIDAAIKQYTLNLKALESNSSYEAKLLRARTLNDRGVASYLRSEMFDRYEPLNTNLVTSYSKNSARDFASCKQLLEELARERPGREQGREELSKILELNQKFYANELVFAPREAK